MCLCKKYSQTVFAVQEIQFDCIFQSKKYSQTIFAVQEIQFDCIFRARNTVFIHRNILSSLGKLRLNLLRNFYSRAVVPRS